LHLKRLIGLTAIALCAATTGMTANAMATTITGAGSTLVAPLENEWATDFMDANPGTTVTYNGVGSGGGIADVSQNLVDFGATDAPLFSAKGQTCSPCVLVPWALSATGIGYNIPNVGAGLKLSGKVLAEIYMGQITNWNNSQIANLNKGVHLPSLTITPVYRSDTSGDSYAFQNFLSDVDGAWASKYSYGIQFPLTTGVGEGESGNSGVASAISSTSGAIGYVSASYLIAERIDVAKVENAKGHFEYPNLSNIEQAADQVKSVPAGNALHIVDPPKKYKTAYPISTFTYALVHSSGNSDAAGLKSWLDYCLTTGRRDGVGIDFAPIPSVVQRAALNTVSGIS
jgi:phosphate transport system substrate-binding protein